MAGLTGDWEYKKCSWTIQLEAAYSGVIGCLLSHSTASNV